MLREPSSRSSFQSSRLSLFRSRRSEEKDLQKLTRKKADVLNQADGQDIGGIVLGQDQGVVLGQDREVDLHLLETIDLELETIARIQEKIGHFLEVRPVRNAIDLVPEVRLILTEKECQREKITDLEVENSYVFPETEMMAKSGLEVLRRHTENDGIVEMCRGPDHGVDPPSVQNRAAVTVRLPITRWPTVRHFSGSAWRNDGKLFFRWTKKYGEMLTF